MLSVAPVTAMKTAQWHVARPPKVPAKETKNA
jgi:hypothetical protein